MSTTSKQPYVCIPNVSSRSAAKHIASLMRKFGFDGHFPMVSVPVSSDTLYRGQGDDNPKIPPIVKLPEILGVVRDEVSTSVRYYSGNGYSFALDVARLLDANRIYKRNLIDNVQFCSTNSILPNSATLQKIKADYPKLTLTLLISPELARRMSPSQMAETISEKYGFVNYVIIDVPNGKEPGIEITHAARLYRQLKLRPEHQTMGFGHRFSDDNKQQVTQLIEEAGSADFCLTTDAHSLKDIRSYLRGISEALFLKPQPLSQA